MDPQELVVSADEEWGQHSPWNSIYKLECVVKKCGRSMGEATFETLRWILHSVADCIRNNVAPRGTFTVRYLSGKGLPGNKGACDLFIFKKMIKGHFSTFMAECGGSSGEQIVDASMYIRDHSTYRQFFGYEHTVVGRNWLHNYPKCLQELLAFYGDCVAIAKALATLSEYLSVFINRWF